MGREIPVAAAVMGRSRRDDQQTARRTVERSSEESRTAEAVSIDAGDGTW
jgi:hypothetical protein